MITVKQILEHYNIVTEKASNDTKNLAALVHAGLLEESKLTILNRALSKPVNMMTEAEKKSLQGVVESLASQIISEKQDYLSKLDTSRSMSYPSEKEIPAVIILKRKAIRVYPDNQKVALYYSQALDRYISIPYGKNSKALDMTLNEEVRSKRKQIRAVPAMQPTLPKPSETQQTIAQFRGDKDKSNKSNMASKDSKVSAGDSKEKSSDDRLAQIRGMTAKERAAAGVSYTDAIKAIVSTNAPASAQVGTAIGVGLRRLVGLDRPQPQPSKASSPTQQTSSLDPQQRVIGGTRAVPQTNRPVVKESFRKHLEEKRQEKLDEFAPLAVPAIASGVSGVLTAGRTALQLGSAALRTPAGQAVTGAITSGASKAKDVVKNIFSKKPPSKAQQRLANRQQRQKRQDKGASGGGVGSAIANMLGGGSGGSGGSDEPLFKPITGKEDFGFGQISQGPSATVGKSERVTIDPTAARAQRALYTTNESNNNLDIMKQIVEQNIPSYTLYISETPITINKRVAKKVVAVYESLNRQNKKKIEKMLNEDAMSFKKAINFAIKA